jgi:hypothetical protein
MEVQVSDRNTPEQYEEPTVADYGDLAEITAKKTFVPTTFDGNYNSGQVPPPTGVFS